MDNLSIFVMASLAVIIVPGPDMILVMTRGVAGGSRIGAASALGVGMGLLTHSAAAAFGISLLIQNHPLLFTMVRILGALYMLYLGISLLRSSAVLNTEGADGGLRAGRCVWQGYLSNLMNPKIILFFLAFLPQFVSSEADNFRLQMVLRGSFFTLLTFALYVLIGLFSASFGRLLTGSSSRVKRVNTVSAFILILLGVGILLHR